MKVGRRNRFDGSGVSSQKTYAANGSYSTAGQRADSGAAFERNDKNPTPKVKQNKIPPLTSRNRCAGVCLVLDRVVGNVPSKESKVLYDIKVTLPVGGYSRLLAYCGRLSRHQKAGVLMVAALLWESLKVRGKHGKRVMKLSKCAARQFIDRVNLQTNAATFVANAWMCEPESKGSCPTVGGKVANRWFVPSWWNGQTEIVHVALSPLQMKKWKRRNKIIQECSDQSNPAAMKIRDALKSVVPHPDFQDTGKGYEEKGRRDAVDKYLRCPHKYNITVDGDIQSNFSRLPSELRTMVSIAGLSSVELDIQSAHPHLLGQFYKSESGDEWAAEYKKFKTEALLGFPSLYGEAKEWKKSFLAAINQKTHVAIHTSEGYKKLEELFPLLAGKIHQLKIPSCKAVGRTLRCELAKIAKGVVLENDKDHTPTIPVVDSVVIGVPSDIREAHRATFYTAWRLGVPLAEITGTDPLVRTSNGEKYQFHM